MTAPSSAMQCKANCVLIMSQQQLSTNVTVLGSLSLVQQHAVASDHGPAGSVVRVQGTLQNLSPGPHGLSVCVAGDLSKGAASCGSIFNPFGKTHGAPSDPERMVGDWGNIVADENGTAVVDITDRLTQLVGPHSIVGRSLVVTSGADDMGRGGHEHSLVTGNSGPRVAAGVIGLVV